MVSCRRLMTLVVFLVVAALAHVGCTTEVDYSMGSEFIPTDQKMEMHRRVYKGGNMYYNGEQTPLSLATTQLYRTDSIKSSNLDNVYFGYERNADFGERKAGFMSQVLFGSKLDEEYGWGYRPIFDSMQLALYVTDFHGDTTKRHRFNVYEIVSNDYLKGDGCDSIFYINFDPGQYVAQEPIFTFEYPNQELGVYVGDMENPQPQSVTLTPTAATDEYISRLMFTTNLAETDGYGLDKDEIYEQGNEEVFVDRIRGIYVTPAEAPVDGEGAMFATDVENTAMVLYARSRYKEDPTIIKDTTIMSYNFYVDPTSYDVKAGNVSLSMVEHELPETIATDIELGVETRVSYVDGMGGVVTELQFSDEFIQSLADLVHSVENPDAVISVNQAHMSIYLEGSDYDYLLIDPITMTTIMDASMPRMGLYTRYGGTDANDNNLIAISDYAYTSENSVVLDYDGYINRSLGCYTMDISTHIQSLMMAAADNVDEQGRVKLEKFNPDSAEADMDLVPYRRIYIAPAADQLFGFNRQKIYGGDSVDVEGMMSNAPIMLELTYTIVN